MSFTARSARTPWSKWCFEDTLHKNIAVCCITSIVEPPSLKSEKTSAFTFLGRTGGLIDGKIVATFV